MSTTPRSDRGAGERKGGPANSMAGLPRLGRRWKGVSPAAEASSRKGDGEGAARARREGVGGVGGFTEGGVGFYRVEVRPSVFMANVEGASMAGVEGVGYQLLKRGKRRRVTGE
jgi:hypothetical protein